MEKIILACVVFVVGGVGMVIEFVGFRLVTPYLGSSLMVWSAIVSVILGCLSIGYWFGGKLADKRPYIQTLTYILFLSGLSVASIKPLEFYMVPFLVARIDTVQISSPVVAFLLFGPANVLFGMVLPYAVRLALIRIKNSGALVGKLYACSTVGSITGTLLVGYYLLSHMGHAETLRYTALLLFLFSVLICFLQKNSWKKIVEIVIIVMVIFVTLFINTPKVSYAVEIDTPYNRVWVLDVVEQDHVVRKIVNNPSWDGYQSAVQLDAKDTLYSPIYRFFRLVDYFQPGIKTSLLIGGGGYTIPRDFLTRHKNATMDVVEIDPGMTAVAKKYLFLTDNPRLSIFHEDGRVYLNKATKKYDAIFLNAFDAEAKIPFHLITEEAFIQMKNNLTPDGGVYINIVAQMEGRGKAYFDAIYRSMSRVFPQVDVFPLFPSYPWEMQNILLVCFKTVQPDKELSSDIELRNFFAHQYKTTVSEGIVLTDNYAPLESLTAL